MIQSRWLVLVVVVSAAPVPAVGQEGRVFRALGDWRLASESMRVLEQGDPVGSSDTLLSPFEASSGARISIWFDEGRVTCGAETGGVLQCDGMSDGPCFSSREVGGSVSIELAPCLRTGGGSSASAFLAVVLRLFGEEPRRYLPLLSRSMAATPEEAVLLAGREALPLREVIGAFPRASYRLCLRPLEPEDGEELCTDTRWDGSSGAWHETFSPGRYELTVIGRGRPTSAWVLFASEDRFDELKAEFDAAKRHTRTWTRTDQVEVRAALRAFLAELSTR